MLNVETSMLRSGGSISTLIGGQEHKKRDVSIRDKVMEPDSYSHGVGTRAAWCAIGGRCGYKESWTQWHHSFSSIPMILWDQSFWMWTLKFLRTTAVHWNAIWSQYCCAGARILSMLGRCGEKKGDDMWLEQMTMTCHTCHVWCKFDVTCEYYSLLILCILVM